VTLSKRLSLLVAAVFALLLVVAGCGQSAGNQPASGSPSASGPTASAGPAVSGLAPAKATTSLATVKVAELPVQAQDTLVLIKGNGPYPYDKDGTTFGNREAVLPRQPSGFYREYTVTTPGAGSRGARRIVAGNNGSRFYTDDHYASFREVIS
jgi:ribonuclease T1